LILLPLCFQNKRKQAMAKSLLLLSYCGLAQAARLTASSVDEAPPAGSQMIQLKASGDGAESQVQPDTAADSAGNKVDSAGNLLQIIATADDAVKAETMWRTIYTDSKRTCGDEGSVLTWNAKVDTADKCQQACESWGETQVNQNSNRPCGAAYFYHKADGSPFCRLFETCDKCASSPFAGTTFTSFDHQCGASCSRADCRKDAGFKPKQGFAAIQCATPECTTDECCDLLPGWTTEEVTTTTVTTTTPPLKGVPSHVTYCGDGWFSKLSYKHVNAKYICYANGYKNIASFGGNGGELCKWSYDRKGRCGWNDGTHCGNTVSWHCTDKR